MAEFDKPTQVKDSHVNHNITAFEIDHRIKLYIEQELAINLGKLVLDSDTKNTALLALGHQLRNLANGR